MNYIFFDEPTTWQNLLPLTFTKPLSELRVGILRIREKWEKQISSDFSHLTESYLSAKYPLIVAEDNLLINAAVFPDESLLKQINGLNSGEAIKEGEKLIAARMGKAKVETYLSGKWTAEKSIPASGEVSGINYPWDIFSLNGQEIQADFKLLTAGRKSAGLSKTNQLLKPENIFVEEGVKAECSVFNASTGPIYLGAGSEIMEGSLIRGPFAICEYAGTKMGTKIYGPTTIGPYSKVGGEINNSVITGYSNKAHDGFLGNSVIGEWCNIGADSNNSNLKNNYTEVRVWNYPQEKFISTSLLFCGLIMGDHSKCGINTMFNTGTVVGVNANIFGSGFPRTFIPSFSWGGPQGFSTFQLNKAFEVAEAVMSRRETHLDELDKNILQTVFERSKKYRK